MDTNGSSSPHTAEENLAAVGRRIDKIIYKGKLAKKQLSHRLYGILIVVAIVIICTFVTLVYIEPTKEAGYAGVATLISVLWLVPSAMFYIYNQRKCMKVIDFVIEQSVQTVTTQPGPEINSVMDDNTSDQNIKIQPPAAARQPAFQFTASDLNKANLKSVSTEPKQSPTTLFSELQQKVHERRDKQTDVHEPTTRVFARMPGSLETQFMEKNNERSERNAMAEEDNDW